MLHSPFLTSVARENSLARAWMSHVEVYPSLQCPAAACHAGLLHAWWSPSRSGGSRSLQGLLPFFRDGGDGVNGWLLRYLCGHA
jgi:hypothetical protein